MGCQDIYWSSIFSMKLVQTEQKAGHMCLLVFIAMELMLINNTTIDLDGNGYWDQMEVKALFKKELDKMYDPNAPEDDLNERYEEMERMREHVFKESDTDKDNLIRSVYFL